MANGRNDAVEIEEENFREKQAEFIAKTAAALVAAGDETRENAIEKATEFLRDSGQADADLTGTLEAELSFPRPSKNAPDAQVREIARELMDAARDAADDL